MAELLYNAKDMASVGAIEITYTDNEHKLQELKTEIKFASDANFTVFFRSDKDYNIRCPQDIAIKYVINNNLYLAETTLLSVKKLGTVVLLTIQAPQKIKQIKTRNYCRVCLDRTCILIAIDNVNNKDVFLSNSIDISAGGVLLHKLESAIDNAVAKIEPRKYNRYVIIMCLDKDIVLKLSAKYIRTECTDGNYNYAFEFTGMNQANINTISKYVTSAQVKKLGTQYS